MKNVICDKCHSRNVKIIEFKLPFYNSVRVRCLRCGRVYKMTQRWLRSRRWKQTGYIHTLCERPMPPQEIRIKIDFNPEEE